MVNGGLCGGGFIQIPMDKILRRGSLEIFFLNILEHPTSLKGDFYYTMISPFNLN